MRFRMCPYIAVFFTLGFCLYGLMTILFILGVIFLPNGRIELLVMTGVGVLMLGLLLTMFRRTGFPWIFISCVGVQMRGLFGFNTMLSWEECADVGIMRRDIGNYGIHRWLYWMYFSKTVLSDEQRNSMWKFRWKEGDFIMLEFREEALEEVLKYIEQDRIRNLHLIPDKKRVQ